MRKIILLLFITIGICTFASAKSKKAKKEKSKKQTEVVDSQTTIKETNSVPTSTIQKTEIQAPKMETITNIPSNKTTYVVIKTTIGDIKLKLYNETPLHKANFIKIAKEGVLDSTLFHRVIPEFMIQGGDPNSKNAAQGQRLGMGGLNYRVPAELNKNIIHKRGTLAAARDGNPEKASSSTQFYIVVGRKYNENELNILGSRTNNSWTDEQRKTYMEVGGTPMLDMNYTVFGEVVQGMDIVDKIVAAPRDQYDRPYEDIRMLDISIVEE